MRFNLICALATVVCSASSFGATFTITNDTYLNSYYFMTTVDGQPFLVGDDTRKNYGNNGAIKAVSNDGSGTLYPFDNSLVRGLFTLPNDFWSSLGSGAAPQTTVTYRVRNNSLAGRSVMLHPLMHTFVEGTGGMPNDTQNGTSNIPTPLGADWITYDGTNNWTTPGGDFDAASFVLHTARTEGSAVYFDWNITNWLNDPSMRNLIQTNGFLLRVTDETNFIGNQFASLWSAETPNTPTVTTVVPEPTTLGLIVVSVGLMARRRRSR